MNKCPYCSNELVAGQTYCSRCGTRVSGDGTGGKVFVKVVNVFVGLILIMFALALGGAGLLFTACASSGGGGGAGLGAIGFVLIGLAIGLAVLAVRVMAA